MRDPVQVRAFDWRDLPLLHRVRGNGLCFDSRHAFTRGPHAMQSALLDVFIPGRGPLMVVARDASGGLVGQITHAPSDQLARLSFIGPADQIDTLAGARLLDGLAQIAGGQGVTTLVAEVDEDSQAFESLRLAGFAVYARQCIWRLAPGNSLDSDETDAHAWRLETPDDQAAVHCLYLNLVPGLVQQVEPPPHPSGHSLVHTAGSELLGYLDIERGPLGDWVQPYFHPAVEHAEHLLVAFIREYDQVRRTPLHICVRSYQGWLSTTLGHMGFEAACDQAVMVKRLAASVRRPVTVQLPVLDGTRPEPTTPIMNFDCRAAPGSRHSQQR
jgi:hypothetical protein